ncbi:hypothetical protein [Synechococcus sp. MU1625]|uniref:hypothetical protein n=1 Tax=Synechococcus sp. MU1625 TaxID=2508347 RepID=UPI001CF906FF|nr:hypothetical protein [Synechococcus sp. MU1625]MCB4399018.1 hypothetical protein [Synechococcus sp. MU1625]
MALLWDNLAQQLSNVRASASATAVVTPVNGSGTSDDPSDRRRRLQQALEAVKDSGNAMMIESLNAAIEGREANLNLPELPDGVAKF